MARISPRWALPLVALCLWLAPEQARGTVLVEIPLDDMTFDAEAVVLGEVTGVDVQMVMREDGSLEPWTKTTLRVERWLKAGEGQTVTLFERGGAWPGGGMRIAGTPEYRVGERVVVFLWRDPLGRLRTYGMAQGRFVVRAGAPGVPTTVERDLDDVGFAQWSSAGMTVTHLPPTAMTLDALLARIAHVLEVTQ